MKRLLFLFVAFSLGLSVCAQTCECTTTDVINNCVSPLDTVIGTIDTVSTVQEFKNAINAANTNGGNRTILIENGTYHLATTSSYPYIIASNVVFRSLSGKRDSVIITGSGMNSVAPLTENGFYFVGDNIIISDLTIKDVGNHGIAVEGDHLLVHNVRIQDTYEQMLKGTSAGDGSDYSKVQCCLFEYTAGVGPNFYIGGIDVHEGTDWNVNDNIFKNIASPSGNVAEHAVHFWNSSSDNIIERNIIVNCDRGIGFGLGSSPHDGGIIRNNMIYNDGSGQFNDVGIGLETSPNTKVYNNTIHINYQNAIEYRFGTTVNVDIVNNLTNKAITSRNGGQATLSTNLTNSDINWYIKPSEGNLRLNDSIAAVLDVGTALMDVKSDLDKYTRPPMAIDIGAHEYIKAKELPLLEIQHLKYEGAFRVPGNTQGESSANYAVGTMTLNPENNSFFLAGHAQHNAVAEFSIPELVNSAVVTELNIASFIQGFKGFLDETPDGNPQGIDRISGMEVIGNQLIINGVEWYDAPANNTHTTLIVENKSDFLNSAVTGYYSLEDRAHAAGWISKIPQEWQQILEGPYLLGNSSRYSINGRLTMGVSAYSFDPVDLDPAPNAITPTIELLDFDLTNPLYADYSNYDDDKYNILTLSGTTGPCHTVHDANITVGSNDLWTQSSAAHFGFIVPNTRTYLSIGSSGGHSTGIGYKATQDNGNCCGGPCPYGAEDRYNYYWLWDVNDLVDVKNGVLNPYDVRPYAYGEFAAPLQHDHSSGNVEFHNIVGGDFDPKTGRLYLTLYDAASTGNYDRIPAIIAYKIIYEEICDGIDNNGDGEVDEHQINTWVGPANGNWYDHPSNWSLDHFPNSCNHVKIQGSVTVNVQSGNTAYGYTLEVEQGSELEVDQNAELKIIIE